jgi:hypothetical protein
MSGNYCKHYNKRRKLHVKTSHIGVDLAWCLLVLRERFDSTPQTQNGTETMGQRRTARGLSAVEAT